MESPRMGGLATCAGAALLFAACNSSDDLGRTQPGACTLIGCSSAVTITARLSGTFAALKTYRVEVCVNGACLSGPLDGLKEPPMAGGGSSVSFPDGATVERTHSPHVDVAVLGDTAGIRLEARYWPWSVDDLHDGDAFSLNVKDSSGKLVTSTTGTANYAVSYPNGKECGPMCRKATIGATSSPADAGTQTEASTPMEAGPDASVPPACMLKATSSIPHVHIVAKPTKCVFSLSEARAGISIPYSVVIDEDVPGFIPRNPYSYGANVSALYVSERLSGGTQSYCLCDLGLPYPSCPEPDGGISHPQGGGPCPPITLKKGVYPMVFAWDGVNWSGPSDTNNPKGAPFPPGDYTLEISSNQGSLDRDAHAGLVSISATLPVRVVP